MQKIKRAARAARTLELQNNYAENKKLWEKKNSEISTFLCLLQRRSSDF